MFRHICFSKLVFILLHCYITKYLSVKFSYKNYFVIFLTKIGMQFFTWSSLGLLFIIQFLVILSKNKLACACIFVFQKVFCMSFHRLFQCFTLVAQQSLSGILCFPVSRVLGIVECFLKKGRWQLQRRAGGRGGASRRPGRSWDIGESEGCARKYCIPSTLSRCASMSVEAHL